MHRFQLVLLAALCGVHAASLPAPCHADDEDGGAAKPTAAKHRGPECLKLDRFFVDEVWSKVGERTCLECHRAKGDAADSDFVLSNVTLDRSRLTGNRDAFFRTAALRDGDKSVLLSKVTGGMDHGGGEVVERGSTSYRILESYVHRASRATGDGRIPSNSLSDGDPRPFFSGVRMMSPERLLRRAALSLVGRLPSADETAAVREGGRAALDGLLDGMMTEDAFYERIKEGFNDIFLTLGYDGNGEEVLSYDHFQPTRLWYQKHDLSEVADAKQRQRARWDLARVYRDAIRREPLELIEHIVRHDRPFTELVTADYIMVSPYSARGYGVFEEMREKFTDPNDPFEYHPTKLPPLKSRNGKEQESASGFYPHSGLLSMFHYLRRYPTTATNRNRLRARMYYQHFLGIDVLELAPRVRDAAAVSTEYDNPTMQAADCVVCHKTIDPVAGLFQDFNEGGHLGPRKDGWHTDMFGAGLEGEEMPAAERWRSLQWLGERTARDPRFAVAMVEHVYYILVGRRVLSPPADIDDPLFRGKRRAYLEQRALIETAAIQFTKNQFNLKSVFKRLIDSDFYRADSLAVAIEDPQRLAELDDIGLVRMLTPEQLERKITAIFGQKWGRLVNRESRFKILYGGIDSKSVTERVTDPSGAMGAIQRIMANDVACKNVALDFTRPANERRLFPQIEPDVVPGGNAAAEKQIRRAIVHLHAVILGRDHEPDDAEVSRTYRLFAGIVADAKAAKGIDKRGSYFCERVNERYVNDPHYTVRAWRGVVTYLLRQHDFLYE
ncbi:MAG: hypothetical protein QGG36_06840 [Pirellulaceae bacterium]|jgi:hypothetical protein|nr:hypothetical protein [Pirellulaceae bacterium]